MFIKREQRQVCRISLSHLLSLKGCHNVNNRSLRRADIVYRYSFVTHCLLRLLQYRLSGRGSARRSSHCCTSFADCVLSLVPFLIPLSCTILDQLLTPHLYLTRQMDRYIALLLGEARTQWSFIKLHSNLLFFLSHASKVAHTCFPKVWGVWNSPAQQARLMPIHLNIHGPSQSHAPGRTVAASNLLSSLLTDSYRYPLLPVDHLPFY